MRNVLADLAIESEAATVGALRCARAFDADEPAFRRFATAVSKYHVCKRASNVAALDVLRALAREPEGPPAFLAECELAAGADAPLTRSSRARCPYEYLIRVTPHPIMGT